MLIEVYSDGSGTTGDQPGGWAFVICVDGVKVAEGSGSLSKATNNVAEVTAASEGLRHVATTDIPGYVQCNSHAVDDASDKADVRENEPRIVLISDSQLTLRWATGEFKCKKPHLVPYIIELRKLLNQLNATTKWVKGHNGNEHNERCDYLAGVARFAKISDPN